MAKIFGALAVLTLLTAGCEQAKLDHEMDHLHPLGKHEEMK